MIVQVQRVPAGVGEADLPIAKVLLQSGQLQRMQVPLAALRQAVKTNMLEGEDHVESVLGRISDRTGSFDGGPGHLTDGHEVAGREADFGIHLGDELVQSWAVDDESLSGGIVPAGCWAAVAKFRLF